MRFYHQLRTKLVLVFIVVTLIPSFVIGMYAASVSSTTLRMQALTTQTETVRSLENIIKSFLSKAKGDLLFLSQSAPMREYLNLRTVIALDSHSESIPLGSETATQQAMENILEPKQKALEQEFLSFSRNRRIYYQIRYLDETGQEIVRIDADGFGRSRIIDQKLLQNKADRYYFKDTMRLSSKQVFVSKLDLNRERGQIEKPYKPVIRYAVNVYYPNNRRAGIVITNIDANQFLKELGNVLLVDQEGYFLNHPDSDKCWGSSHDLDTKYSFKTQYPDLNTRIILGKDGTKSTKTVTISYKKVTVPGSTQYWTLIALRDTHEILKSVIDFRISFSIILMISVFIALFLAVFFSAKITRPIEHLTRLADAISKGELVDNRVEIKDKGEIGQLAQAFERMRVSMIKSFERLRKQSRV